jgi:Holliday junction resolvase RusA-like endonuclease
MEADVLGVPVPQGSKRVFNGHLVDVNHAPLRAWRGAIAHEIGLSTVLTGPVFVKLDFFLSRPKGHFGTGRNENTLKPSAPVWPKTKPDLDKLVRACLDAMTGMVYADDSQVAALAVTKNYADGRQPGVHIEVEEM